MFEARLIHSGILRKVLDAIKDLVTEANFKCTREGMVLHALDSTKVSLVSVSLPAKCFDKYKCDDYFWMGVNVASMAKIMKCADSEDVLTMKAQEDANTVTFKFETQAQENVCDYEMRLIDVKNEYGLDDRNHSCIVNMPSREFARICRKLSHFSESVKIECTKEYVNFAAEGDTGIEIIKLIQNAKVDEEEGIISIEVNKEPVTLIVSIKYLNCFSKATPLCNQVQLSMAADYPLMVEYKIGKFGYIRYYLDSRLHR